MKRATIKDIALLTGVNVSTVSRALKDHPDIGLALRNKIKNIAEELNYRPNMTAVQLRKQKSHLIGLIIPEAYMFFFPSVVKGISDVIQQYDYKLMVLQSQENLDKEIDNVRICYEYGVDGLLMTLTNKTKNLNHLDDIKKAGVPIVLLDKVLDDSGFDEVIIDDIHAAQMCTQYLIDTGCINILGLFGNANLMITQKRLQGFMNAEDASNGKKIERHYLFADDTFAAWQAVEEHFKSQHPDGIFAMSDEIIAGVIAPLKKMQVNIPQDCSVIGISDGYLPQILDPQVTYLHHDGYTLGKMAATHLIQKMSNRYFDVLPDCLVMPTKLIIKNSTR